MTFHEFYQLFQWRGIPVLAHWSLLAVLGVIGLLALDGGLPLLVLALGVLVVLVVHELGHAYAAVTGGCRVEYIQLYPLVGRCVYVPSRAPFTEARIVWGGVTAQAILFAGAMLIATIPGVASSRMASLALGAFGPINLSILLFNLIPIRGLDGYMAWRRFPVLVRGYRRRFKQRKGRRCKR